MRTADIGIFKSCAKDALLKWSDNMVDQLLPGRVSARTVIKNGIGNVMEKFSDRIDSAIDSLFMFLGNKDGSIDSDHVIDMICELLKEAPLSEHKLGPFNAKIGKGEVAVTFPNTFLSEFVLGDLGGFKITPDDIQEIKKILND